MIFTALDLTGGYNQKRMVPEYAKYLNIVLPFGTYQYNVMPQGLSPSVEGFQRPILYICGSFPFVLIYLDNILTFHNSEEEHVEHFVM